METDPGPLARFLAVTADPMAPEIIVQRVAMGETLRDVAKSWGLPRLRFLAWVAANGDLTEQCKRVRELAGIELRMEGLDIVDEATPETAPVAKIQSDYRERLSRDLNRPLFGKYTKHEHAHSLDWGERLRRARERVIEQDSMPAPLSASGGVTLTAQMPSLAGEMTRGESARPPHSDAELI